MPSAFLDFVVLIVYINTLNQKPSLRTRSRGYVGEQVKQSPASVYLKVQKIASLHSQ